MARHYTNKEFFRQMPNVLLARYFHVQGLFNDLDFSAMKEGKPDELFTAWLALAEGQRSSMVAEFRDIFEMSCEKGLRAMIDEAEFQLDEEAFTVWVEMLSALPTHSIINNYRIKWKVEGNFISLFRYHEKFYGSFTCEHLYDPAPQQ